MIAKLMLHRFLPAIVVDTPDLMEDTLNASFSILNLQAPNRNKQMHKVKDEEAMPATVSCN